MESDSVVEDRGISSVRKPLLGDQILEDGMANTSFMRMFFNELNILSEVGILSIPYRLSEGGWLSLALLILVEIMFYYTGLLRKRYMAVDPRIRSYPDIGDFIFGCKRQVLHSKKAMLYSFGITCHPSNNMAEELICAYLCFSRRSSCLCDCDWFCHVGYNS